MHQPMGGVPSCAHGRTPVPVDGRGGGPARGQAGHRVRICEPGPHRPTPGRRRADEPSRRRRRRAPGPARSAHAGRRSALDVVLTTAVTRLDETSLRFRGHDPAELARREPFEAVARLLWLGRLDRARGRGRRRRRAGADVAAALAPDTSLLDRLRIVATVVGAADPFRGDLRPEAVVAAGAGCSPRSRRACRSWARPAAARARRPPSPRFAGRAPVARLTGDGAGPARCGR